MKDLFDIGSIGQSVKTGFVADFFCNDDFFRMISEEF